MVFQDNTPIYVQIANDIKDHIVSGKLPDGAKLGSVREYSLRYAVTALTVTRALALLEAEGLIATKRGIGNFVRDGTQEALKVKMREVVVRDFVERITNMGLTGDEIITLISEILERRNKHGYD